MNFLGTVVFKIHVSECSKIVNTMFMLKHTLKCNKIRCNCRVD
jgi:hypothetical protein